PRIPPVRPSEPVRGPARARPSARRALDPRYAVGGVLATRRDRGGVGPEGRRGPWELRDSRPPRDAGGSRDLYSGRFARPPPPAPRPRPRPGRGGAAAGPAGPRASPLRPRFRGGAPPPPGPPLRPRRTSREPGRSGDQAPGTGDRS